MSCGRKIHSYYYNKYELADALRDSPVGYREIQKVERGECLDNYELRNVQSALDRHGIREHLDYDFRECC